MVKYVYNLAKLIPGDIILVRYPNDELSQKIREATHSEYSHAILYVGRSSYIEASTRVGARNLSRLLFDDTTDTCVLRIKEDYLSPITINAAIYYARFVVGNPYALADVVRMEHGITDRYTENAQLCTRLVAKAYAFSGLKIVDNVEMCTPQQLMESEYVTVHRDFCREAKDFDLNFAATYDVIDDMIKATETLFDSLKSFNGGRIRNMNDLSEYVLRNPQDDEKIVELVKQSGYLDVLNIEEEKNRYNYDVEEFFSLYGDNAYEAAISALDDNFEGKQMYEREYYELVKRFFSRRCRSHYLIMMISLYKQIIEQHERRIDICRAVMEDPRS